VFLSFGFQTGFAGAGTGFIMRVFVESGLHSLHSRFRGLGSGVRDSGSDLSSDLSLDLGLGSVSGLVSWGGSCKRVVAGSRRFKGSRCHEHVADDIRGKKRIGVNVSGSNFRVFCCVCVVPSNVLDILR
jgi:hypothetical protein